MQETVNFFFFFQECSSNTQHIRMNNIFHCSLCLVSVTRDCRFCTKEVWKDYSAGFIELAVWSRTEWVFCYGAHNPVIPSINTQHFQSVHCGQFCTTHQQTATGFSPNLDASLTFSLFLTKWHKASPLHSCIICVLLLSLSSDSS